MEVDQHYFDMEMDQSFINAQCANFSEISSQFSHLPEEDMALLRELQKMCGDQLSSQVPWYERLYIDYPQYMHTADLLQLYVAPILLIVGTFGNIFSFVILAKNMMKMSTYSYLAVLAIMDISVLYIGLLRVWLGQLTVDIFATANWLCKLMNFLSYVCSDSSVWLIIAVTVERYIAVCFPLRAPRMCNTRRALVVIISIIFVLCLVNAHMLWTVELSYTDYNNSMVPKCEHGADHKTLIKEIWPWVDAAIYSFIPFVIITFLNIQIIRQVLYSRKQRSALQQLTVTSKVNGIVYKTRAKRHCEGSKKLTCMLLAVSFTFLFTTLPMNVLQIVSAFIVPKVDDGSKEYASRYAKIILARTVFELLMYVNHSINFFLYCATGRKFRLQFKVMTSLCCQGKLISFFRTGKKRYNAASFRLTKFNSVSSPRTIVIECDRKMLQNGQLL